MGLNLLRKAYLKIVPELGPDTKFALNPAKVLGELSGEDEARLATIRK